MDLAAVLLLVGICITLLRDCVAAPGDCRTSEIELMWPLGKDIGIYELMTGATEGQAVNTSYKNGSADISYMAYEFKEADRAFAEFPLPFVAAIGSDHSFKFNIFPESDGVFFHFKHDFSVVTTALIKEMKLAIENGDFIMTLSTWSGVDSQIRLSNVFTYNIWTSVILERDISRIHFDVVIGGTSRQTDDFDSWVAGAALAAPGIITIGGSHADNNFFSGGFTCLQLLSCTGFDTLQEFDQLCGQNWPLVPSTTTVHTQTSSTTAMSSTSPTQTASTQSSSAATTTQTQTSSVTTFMTSTSPTQTASTQSTSAATTTQTQTSSVTTSMTSTSPIQTSSVQSTSTVTTPAQTQTSSTTSVTSTSPTQTSSSQSISTTTAVPTTTPIVPPTTVMPIQVAVVNPPISITWTSTSVVTSLWPSISPLWVGGNGYCRHYKMLHVGYTYAHTNVMIMTMDVGSVRECMLHCNRHAQCETFAYNTTLCLLGTSLNQLQYDGVSTIYALVS